MNGWIKRCGATLTIASFAFFGVYFWQHAEELPNVEVGPESWRTMALLVTLQIIVMAASALAWRTIISFTGETKLSRKTALSIFGRAQFAKYIPGNIAQHIGRVLLAKEAGVSRKRTSLSIAIEAIWTIGVGSAIGLFVVSETLSSQTRLPPPTLLAITAILAITAPVFGLPLVIKALQRHFPDKVPNSATLRFSFAGSLACLCVYLASFSLLGFSLDRLATDVFQLQSIDFFYATGICGLAWVAGFITPGSPAGLGIREAVLLLSLAPIYGGGAASSLILSHRLLTATGDLIAYLLASLTSRQKEQ